MVSEPEKIEFKNLFRGSRRSIWIIIFLLSLTSRFIFITFSDQLPVFWDARLYTSSALGIIGYIERDDAFADSTAGLDEYREQYTKNLSGEDIDWLYYKPPTLSEAQKFVFYSGPVYPAIMAAIFILPLPNDFQAVRYFNAIIDSLAILFLSITALLIFHRKWAIWLVASLQLIYLPLIITCGILGLETITSFFISFFILCTALFYNYEKRWMIIGAGIVGGVLFLCKPTAALLTGPLFVFLFIVYFRQWKFLIRAYGLYLVPFLLITIPWIAFTSDYYGELAIRDPEYSTANFRSSSSIEFEGYDLDRTDADFWTYPVMKRIVNDPIGYGHLLIKKVIRLWWTPHDEFWQGPRLAETIIHRMIVILGLCGIAFIPFVRNKLPLFLLLIFLYYTAIHSIFHAVPRYNFNALPALFLLAATSVYYLVENRKIILQKRAVAAVMAGVILALVLMFSNPITGAIVSWVPLYIPIILTLSLLGVFGYGIIKCLPAKYNGWVQYLFFVLPLIVFMFSAISIWARPQLKELSYTASDSTTKFETTIFLPDNFRMTPDDKIYLVLDLTTSGDDFVPIQIDINDLLLEFRDCQPPSDKQFYIKGSYRAFETYMDFDKRKTRWYRKIRLKPERMASLLKSDPILKVTVSMAGKYAQGDRLSFYGVPMANFRNLNIPSIKHYSIERFKEFGDRRVYQDIILSSDSSQSNLMNTGSQSQSETDDIDGRWGVFLYIQKPDFTEQYY
ncbi:MAG: glycosyltransferase family 39 protein [candidate division Zixibacteria bacterium]|nr:glycosyltransferase family 39 protein [candidate division Zixibacteria bacterium]